MFAVFSGRFDQPERHRSHPSLCATAGSEERQHAILQSGKLRCANLSVNYMLNDMNAKSSRAMPHMNGRPVLSFNLSQSHIYYLQRGLGEVLTSPYQHKFKPPQLIFFLCRSVSSQRKTTVFLIRETYKHLLFCSCHRSLSSVPVCRISLI